MSARPGSKPWNWKGEPIVDPRGYVIVHVGKDHPLADCRGYAYQHRLVAAERDGLEAVISKEVHHENEVKFDNCPTNLEPMTRAEHRVRHRKRGARLRLPGEINPNISCACGCGTHFKKFDSSGRPRLFVSGHNVGRNALGQFEVKR